NGRRDTALTFSRTLGTPEGAFRQRERSEVRPRSPARPDRRSLPVPVLGKSSTRYTSLGHLYGARWARAWSSTALGSTDPTTAPTDRRRRGRARRTVPGRASHSSGEHTVNWASVAP